MQRLRHIRIKLIALALLLPVSFIICLWTGEISVSVNDILHVLTGQDIQDETSAIILYEFRLPEALTAMIASAALAISGLIMQSYFRNPLAGPSVMGVSSGASFGIALLLVCFPQLLTGEYGSKFFLVGFASGGAILVLALLAGIQFRLKNMETLLIAGLLISYFLSACVSMLLSNTEAQNIKTFVHWGFGSFSKTGYGDIAWLFCACTALGVLGLLMSRALDAFQFSDETVANSGINRHRSGQAMIILSGLMCAVVTAFCGPVAFIGLCVPHVARMLFKTSRHIYLITGSILIAAHIGMLCTAVSRLTFFGQSLPINSVTSFLGAPFILYILIAARRNRLA